MTIIANVVDANKVSAQLTSLESIASHVGRVVTRAD